jgi:hypothetical protein
MAPAQGQLAPLLYDRAEAALPPFSDCGRDLCHDERGCSHIPHDFRMLDPI